MPDSLRDHRVRHLEINTTLIIQLHGRGQIDIGKGILLLAIAVEHNQHFIRDRVVLYFLDPLVQKYQNDGQVFRLKLGLLLGLRGRLRRRRSILALLAQFLHFIGETIDLIHRLVLRVIVILLLIVRGTAPIPERAIPAVVGIAPIPAAAKTVVVKMTISNNQERSMIGAMEGVARVEAGMGSTGKGCWGSTVKATAGSSGAHPAEARASMESAAALCRTEAQQDEWHRDHENKSPHAAIIAPLEASGEKNDQCFFFAGVALCATGVGLGAGFGATAFLGLGLGGGVVVFPLASGFAAGDGGAAATGAAAPFPFFFPVSAAGMPAAAAAAFAALPRFAGGGGGRGGGGGANGFRNFRVSVRERSLPSSKRRNTSWAIFGYSGSWGVMCNSVISGSGIFCCTWRHLVKKFLIFCKTAC